MFGHPYAKNESLSKPHTLGTFLVAQCLSIYPPSSDMHGAAMPTSHNYWVCVPQLERSPHITMKDLHAATKVPLATNEWMLKNKTETSLVIQWLRLWAPNAGALGWIPGQGARSHMPQEEFTCCNYRSHTLQLKTWRGQINKYTYKNK